MVEKLAEQFASDETGLDRDAFYNRRHAQVPMGHMGEAFDVDYKAHRRNIQIILDHHGLEEGDTRR